MEELTKHQIARQNFVDNAVFDLIKELIPEDKAKNLRWDIEGLLPNRTLAAI